MKLTKTLLDKLKKDPLPVLKSLTEAEIAQIIQKANYEYYTTQTPIFSDNTFDLIKEYLEEINPHHPILKAVGTGLHGEKFELPYFMASLDKIKTDEKILEKFKSTYKCSYMVSDKLDGNSAMYYVDKNGVPKLYTRGDGQFGQDITHLLPFLRHIPKNIPSSGYAIRGELIISKKDFAKVSDKGANARNMVAGIINAKTPDLELAQLVQFVAYELVHPRQSFEEQMLTLKQLDFKVVYHQLIGEKLLTTSKLSEILVDRRSHSEFEVDGIVVYHNQEHAPVKENPPYGFAFKSIHTMDKAEVIVTRVEWSISKDKMLKPVVIFNPVPLSGVMVQKATGFNGKFISENKIGPGSKIVVMRSGDVIPYITEILQPSATGEGQMPDNKYVWTDTKVDIMLDMQNEDKSVQDAVDQKNLEHFFDKLDFKGISSGTIAKLYAAGYKTPKSILQITKSQLEKVDGFQSKLAEKVHTSIHVGKQDMQCLKVMEASNTLGRGFGAKKLQLIVESIPTIMTKKYVPSVTELVAVKGVEKKTAEAFVENLPKFFKFLKDNDIKCTGMNEEDVKKTNLTPTGSSLVDMVVVFTGVRDKAVEEFVTKNGGKVGSGVNKKTTIVVTKSLDGKATGKIKDAMDLNIPVVTLEQFKQQINFSS